MVCGRNPGNGPRSVDPRAKETRRYQNTKKASKSRKQGLSSRCSNRSDIRRQAESGRQNQEGNRKKSNVPNTVIHKSQTRNKNGATLTHQSST